jgi:nitrogenase subunit NifH
MVIASEQKILKNMVSPIEQKNSSTLNDATSASSKVRKIAVLTSGGDAPGMNCAVRAIVRAALIKKCIPYGIMEGYQGISFPLSFHSCECPQVL